MPKNANLFLVGGNDEHGLEPPTPGKRTPVMPYINRPIYENQFNYPTKNYFLMAALRTGYNILDVKPEMQDIGISTRVRRVNIARPNALVTFAYNAYGSGLSFNQASGIEVFYYLGNANSVLAKRLSFFVYEELIRATKQRQRGIKTLDIGMLKSVNAPSTLVEAGFMTNFAEAKLMLDPDYQKTIAESSAKGVSAFLDVEYIPPIVSAKEAPVLRQGARGKAVAFLQYALIQNGYSDSVGNVDGIFGTKTTGAVTSFQSDNALVEDGIVGAKTWERLLVLNPSAQTLKIGDSGSYVRYVQQKLYAKLYPLTIDNKFDADTEKAVIEFQKENGLTADGIVGVKTLAKLMPIGGGRTLD